MYIQEACVDSLAQALQAQELGATRIELCAQLELDGLSPSQATIAEAKRLLNIPIRVMIRPHNDGFVYHSEDIQWMEERIDFCRKLGVEGVVFGFLDQNQEVDIALTNALIQRARPLKTVFHRAIEASKDMYEGIQKLMEETSIDAILTSGGIGKAEENIDSLKKIKALMKDRELVACGKITSKNLPLIHQKLNLKAYHGKLIVGNLAE